MEPPDIPPPDIEPRDIEPRDMELRPESPLLGELEIRLCEREAEGLLIAPGDGSRDGRVCIERPRSCSRTPLDPESGVTLLRERLLRDESLTREALRGANSLDPRVERGSVALGDCSRLGRDRELSPREDEMPACPLVSERGSLRAKPREDDRRSGSACAPEDSTRAWRSEDRVARDPPLPKPCQLPEDSVPASNRERVVERLPDGEAPSRLAPGVAAEGPSLDLLRGELAEGNPWPPERMPPLDSVLPRLDLASCPVLLLRLR